MLTRNATWPGPRQSDDLAARAAKAAARVADGPMLGAVLAFQRRHRLSDGQFNKLVGMTGDYVNNLRLGRQSKPLTQTRVRAAMADYERSAGQ